LISLAADDFQDGVRSSGPSDLKVKFADQRFIVTNIITILLSIVFLFLAGIHLYWGIGGKWGSKAVIPTNHNGGRVLKPDLKECLVVTLAFLLATFLLWEKAVWLPLWLPEKWVKYGITAMIVVFFLQSIGDFKYVGFFKKIKGTPFAKMDNKLFTPLCLLLAFSLLFLL
jgi:hypothetical protein